MSAEAIAAVVAAALARQRRIVPSTRGPRIGTDCLYFDQVNVSVRVDCGADGETFIAHDDGGAVDRIVAHGHREINAHAVLSRVARRYNLTAHDGVITASAVPIADIGVTICLVANASQEAAAQLLIRLRPGAGASLDLTLLRGALIISLTTLITVLLALVFR